MRRNHSIVACSRHIYLGIVLRAHPVRGESHVQRNVNGEVATLDVQYTLHTTKKRSKRFPSALLPTQEVWKILQKRCQAITTLYFHSKIT